MPQPSPTSRRKACVIGAGPNGLSAAIVLAQAGLDAEGILRASLAALGVEQAVSGKRAR